MKKQVFSFRIDPAQNKCLHEISHRTKTPISRLLEQAIDQTLITYSLYVSDKKLRDALLTSNLNLMYNG